MEGSTQHGRNPGVAATRPVAIVSARGRARIEAGHPWVFRQDVTDGPPTDARAGGPSTVWVTDGRGNPLALATWAAEAKLALRVLQRLPRGTSRAATDAAPPVLLDLVSQRFDEARARRAGIEEQRNAWRVVHAEADGLPGLFVDRYADAAVVQTTSVAMDAARPAIARLVRERLGVRLVVAREDSSMRDFEGLPRFAQIIEGDAAAGASIVYQLGPNALGADLLTDGKTGGFLDQADNHRLVAALAPSGARCLDAFSYHGGFALALARHGGPVLATDESPDAVARIAANAQRNGLANLEARQANAFDLLRALEAEGRRFDVVVLDPPAFAKRAGAIASADRAYHEIFLRGLRLVEPGGLAVLCSCSGQVTRDHFGGLVAGATSDSGRTVQIVARLGAGRDHPELVGVPETGHLKVWVTRVIA